MRTTVGASSVNALLPGDQRRNVFHQQAYSHFHLLVLKFDFLSKIKSSDAC
jgi:hypothetical protein